MQKKVVFSKTTWLYAGCSALILLLLSTQITFGILLYARITNLENSLSMQSVLTGGREITEEKEKYILREYAGRIGVFAEESDQPAEILGVYVFTLPAQDRAALKIGITVYGEKNLRALIEDFTA